MRVGVSPSFVRQDLARLVVGCGPTARDAPENLAAVVLFAGRISRHF